MRSRTQIIELIGAMSYLKDYLNKTGMSQQIDALFFLRNKETHTKLLYEQLKPHLSVSQKQTGSEK